VIRKFGASRRLRIFSNQRVGWVERSDTHHFGPFLDPAVDVASRPRSGSPWPRRRAARRTMLLRTAKSCGPDAPTLASSSRMASRPYRARTGPIFRKRRWQKSPVTGESAKETVKTIACGNAGCSGVLVVNTRVRSTNTKCTRGCGCSGHPAFPTPSTGRKIHQRLGRFAPRGRRRI
jgi:hypothetical protein